MTGTPAAAPLTVATLAAMQTPATTPASVSEPAISWNPITDIENIFSGVTTGWVKDLGGILLELAFGAVGLALIVLGLSRATGAGQKVEQAAPLVAAAAA